MRKNYLAFFSLLLCLCFSVKAQQPQQVGEWSDVIPFNLIPVAAANLPDGRILTWSSRFKDANFDGNDGFTYTEIFDPKLGPNGRALGLKLSDNNHNMFCPGVNNLPDGSILVAGGGSNPRTTIYDPVTERWIPSSEMNKPRGYQGNVTVGNGLVFTIGGQWSGGRTGKNGEVWTPETGWKNLPGIPMEVLFNSQDLVGNPIRPADHAWVWAAPNGKVFHAGPSEDMHWLDLSGNGSYTFAGKRANDRFSISGTTVMFDIGKILKVGGAINYSRRAPASENSYVIDINNENNVTVTPTANRVAFPRVHHNSVVLPNGEVLVLGGVSTARTFSDFGARMQGEIWNPTTNSWRTIAAFNVPRNYHSVALLMMDGRVFAGGGGLTEGRPDVNHQDAQIYSPPYLFGRNGNLANRPEISAPEIGYYNNTVAVSSRDAIQAFSFIRMSSATHAVNNEQRRVPVSFTKNGNNYTLDIPGANLMPAGYYMLFGIDANGVPSVAEAVRIGPKPVDCSGADGVQVRYNLNGTWQSGQEVLALPKGARVRLSGISVGNSNFSITDPNGNVFGDNYQITNLNILNTGIYTVKNASGCQAEILIKLAATNNRNDLPWVENFNDLPDGTRADDGPTAWTSQSGAISLAVANNALVVSTNAVQQNVPFVSWTSALLDISKFKDVQISIGVNDQDDNKELNQDFVRAYYILDNEPRRLFNEVTGNITPQTFTAANINGTTLRLVIEAAVSTGTESYIIDDIVVDGTFSGNNVTGVVVNPATVNLVAGENQRLSAVVSPADADDPTVVWRSDNTNIATVNANGRVTAVAEGTATITARTTDGGFEAAAIVTVERAVVPVTGVRLDATTVNLLEKEKTNLKAIVSPANADDKSLSWSSSDEDIVKVNPLGRITGIAPGTATITVTTNDGGFQAQATIIVSKNLPPAPTQSSPIIVDVVNSNIWVANPDNNTVCVINANNLNLIGEFAVAADPVSLAQDGQGNVWVSSRDTGQVQLLDATGNIIKSLNLGRGSQPFGVVADPDGQFIYVSLFASNKVVKINTTTQSVIQALDVFANPRAMAITADGAELLVTQFITKNGVGKIARINLTNFTLNQEVNIAADTTSPNTTSEAQGIANYLGGIAIQPNSNFAWFTAKKDNIFTGALRSNEDLGFATTVRAMVSKFSLQTGQENVLGRLDIDNHNLPTAVTVSPLGNYVFVTMLTNQRIVVFETANGQEVLRKDVGFAPSGITIDPATNRLYVKNFLSRSVHVFDADDLISRDARNLPLVDEVNTVGNELLDNQVLEGKQLFYNARDARMTAQENSDAGYISCATCHIDGTHDGQTWDFTQRGEGLRNTISLRGRAGTAHGNLHWSGNFDEIHDFENDIRFAFGGTGFMSDEDFYTSDRENPLGGAKKGKSAALDAIEAYITSLNTFDESPNKRQNGKLTSAARQGKALFDNLQCANCHSGQAFTNSEKGLLYNVGTLTQDSGKRLGRTLQGLDVPTLRDVWATAPYLHDGSAATVSDAIGKHALAANLSASDLQLLEAYVLQLDGAEPAAANGVNLLLQLPSTTAPNQPVSMFVSTDIPNIQEVVYFADDQEIGRSSTAPYYVDFTPQQANNYCVYAKVVHQGMATISKNQNLSIIGGDNPVADNILILEAEDAVATQAAQVGNYITGYQGAGFLDLGAKNSYGEWQFQVPEAQTANLAIVFSSSFIFDRPANVLLNGNSLGEIAFNSAANCFSWQTQDFTDVALQAGINTVKIIMTSDFGGVDIDFLKLELPEKNIAVTGITVSPSSLDLQAGEESQLTATVSPADATDKSMSWTSGDDNIALVDTNGKVRAIAPGVVTITAKTNDGGFEATTTITVTAAAVPVTGVSVAPASLNLTTGETASLTASLSPSNATNTNVSWRSSNTDVAIVDANGLVSAIATGNALITVTTADGGFEASSTISVASQGVPVTGISLDITEGTVDVGYTGFITATVFPENATNKAVVWTSSDNSVGTVDQNGFVTAVGPGSVEITAATVDGGFKAVLNGIVVGDDPGTIAVTGVSLTPAVMTLTTGESGNLVATISPANATNKTLTWATSDSNIVTVDANGNISALAKGGATITVTTNDGGFTATSNITVVQDGNPNIPVSGVAIRPEALEMFVGNTANLAAFISPVDATNKSVSWSSSDQNIVKVDQNGQLTAIAAGVATIAVSTADGGFSASSAVTVKEQDTSVPVTGIALDVTQGAVPVGFTGTIYATVFPENATNKTVVWASSNENVGTVDQDGNVAATGVGTVVITATTADGGYIATLNGTVFAASSGFSASWGDQLITEGARPYIFPNPTDGKMNLDLRDFDGMEVTLSIFNSVQQKVFGIKYAANHSLFEELDARALANGVYYVVFEFDGERAVQQVIIAK